MQRLVDVIPQDLLGPVQDHIKDSGWTYGWHSNRELGYAHWNIDFAQADSSNGLDVSHSLPTSLAMVWQHLQQNHFPNTILQRCYTNSHTYGVEGYPHADSSRSGERTLVIYLNPEWRREWGGETMIYDDQTVVHAELPCFNRGLVFDSELFHCARGVTRICPQQRITLMFKFGPVDADPTRDRLQMFLEQAGAGQLAHSGRNLARHLLRVYDLLHKRGLAASVCLAGGTHSVWGTTIYKQSLLQDHQRPDLVAVIGERAAELVDLFRELDRPRVLENWCQNSQSPLTTWQGHRLDLDESTIRDLCAIEAANLDSQNGLEQRAALKRFWQNLGQ